MLASRSAFSEKQLSRNTQFNNKETLPTPKDPLKALTMIKLRRRGENLTLKNSQKKGGSETIPK